MWDGRIIIHWVRADNVPTGAEAGPNPSICYAGGTW